MPDGAAGLVAEGVRVGAGQPGEPGNAPAFLLDLLARPLAPAVVEPVDVELAVQVVVLVLHHPGEPARRLEFQRVALHIEALDPGPLGTLERIAQARYGQAALGLLVRVRLGP